MKLLEQNDKERISKLLNHSWDFVFKMLVGSSKNEDNVPYREVYKYELSDREKEFPELLDTYLKNDAFFYRESLRNWLITDIIGSLLEYSDCRTVKFISCTNQLYNNIFHILKSYYDGLYEIKMSTIPLEVVETNLMMKENSITDHQIRIVSVGSWDEYVNIFKNYDGTSVDIFKPITQMFGNSLPREATITNLVYDDFHLSCDLTTANGFTEKKLAYLCRKL